MKTIIAATDFSSVSLNAVEYAAKMAVDIGANLLLVHIIELPFTKVPVTTESYAAITQQSTNDLFALQGKLIALTNNKISIETHIGTGTLLTGLNEISAQYEPFAIVMGTEERGLIERFFIGNSTRAALHYLQYPVLVVPAMAKYKKVHKICLACDLKNVYNLPLEQVKILVTAFNTTLDIVHVCKSEDEKLQQHLAATLVEQRLNGIHAKVKFIINKKIEEGISKYAEKHQEDMMLVIPKKRSFIEALLHKSFAKEWNAHPATPVINIAESVK